jgi:hypothetical protein
MRRHIAFRLTRKFPPYPPLPPHYFRAWPDPYGWQEGVWELLIALALLGLVVGIAAHG